MKFSQSLIEEIKNKASLSGVISKTVKLSKKGNEYLGLCPFHNEKTPSFTVSDDKGFYHCFGCQAHGSIFDFIMKTQGIGFQETVIMLAQDLGIDYKIEYSKGSEKNDRYQRLLNLTQEISRWFCDQLNSELGKNAKNYLESRGMPDRIVQKYEVGFSPNSWDNLKSDFLKRG